MTPAARVQAAIEILDLVIGAAKANGPPADRIISEWFRPRRFAGSGDRRGVRELVYGAIRSCGEVPGSGRAALLRLAENEPDLLGLFDGSRYGPEPVRPGETVAAGGIAPEWQGNDKHAHQRALQWLQDLLELQQKAGNPGEFLEHLKIDLFPDEVYVFTPNGEIKKLPRGATVIDFAYDVHSDVGSHCLGARVNHQLVPLRTQLRNGNHIEILTSEWSRPNPSWLDYVVTGKARANIRSYLKHQQHGEALSLGERMLDKGLQGLGSSIEKLRTEEKNKLIEEFKLESWNELLSEIGLGNRQAALVARQLLPEAKTSNKATLSDGALAIRGTEGVVVTYAKCCRPIPGDAILGFLSAGRGIVVHTEDCPNVAEYRKHPERWIDIQWEQKIDSIFPVNIRIDTRNKRGVLANVASAISEFEANIDSVSFDDRDGQTTSMNFVIEVEDRDHLAKVLRAIRHKETVIKVTRTKG